MHVLSQIEYYVYYKTYTEKLKLKDTNIKINVTNISHSSVGYFVYNYFWRTGLDYDLNLLIGSNLPSPSHPPQY